MFGRSDVLNNNIPNNLLGVYYFLNQQDDIIYIGKSIDVKKRMKSLINLKYTKFLPAIFEIKLYSSQFYFF